MEEKEDFKAICPFDTERMKKALICAGDVSVDLTSAAYRIFGDTDPMTVEGKSIKELYNEISSACALAIDEEWYDYPKRNAYYLSAEFLMGRLFSNNLRALRIWEELQENFEKKGLDLNDFEAVEDTALGNGGLGRLAACFLDSAAELQIPLHGYGIRYKYGLFRQRFEDGFQREEADDWQKWGDPWSIRRDEKKREIRFADMTVTAVPYDMPIIGRKINRLRLFQAEGSAAAEKISEYLYPADDTEEGKLLRIRQEYFLSAASMGDLVDDFVEKHGERFEYFSRYNAIQLNDTHAVFSVPELLRIFTQKYRLDFAAALQIAKETFNYTNHTILPEALEQWDGELIDRILPEIATIVKRLQVYAVREWKIKGCSKAERHEMSIVKDGVFCMANLAVFIAGTVNGVAKIHTEIIKEKLFRVAHRYYPKKFVNVTNGVTHRRWLLFCNEELADFYDQKLYGEQDYEKLEHDWRNEFEMVADAFEKITEEDAEEFIGIKETKKEQLAEYVLRRDGIALLPNAIYAAQVKRLHEYKRQLMTAFAILRLYFDLKEGKLPDFQPMSFIFGGKAAAGYRRAKAIIKYVNEISKLVNADAAVRDKLQVVFVENYDVSYAEKIVAGSDVSLQVSTAGFEASGTGNMKFMMNGAVTCGTLDGANIEIVERAGRENNYIFGATVDEIAALQSSYDPVKLKEGNPAIKRVTDTLIDGTFSDGGTGYFRELYDALFEGASWHKPDHYFVLYDLESYVDALLKINGDYRDRESFACKQLYNATRSAFFSSDRAISAYANEIWDIKKIKGDEE